ncbi:MAG: lipopolysaccharide biosynthesis protein [Thermoplasmata archaeon]|nr:lipopolysaccharide biosynthesis protein [Thermoplasmata archaeon]
MGFLGEKMKEARGRPIMVGSSFMTAIFNTVALLVIARNAGPEILGTLGFLIAYMGLFSFVGDLGNGLAFERVLAKGYKFSDCFRAFVMAKVKLTVTMGVVAGLMIALYIYLLAPESHTPLHPVSMFLMLGFFIMVNLASIWVVAMCVRGRRAAPYDTLESIVKVALVVGLIWFFAPTGDQTIIFQLAFIYLISGAIGMMLVRNSARRLKMGESNEEVEVEFQDTAAKMIPFIAFTALILNLDKVVLWLFSDFETLGIYFGAQRITVFIGASAVTIELILGEALSRYIQNNKTKEISETLRMTERYVSLVAMPVTAFYVLFSDNLLQAFLGDNFIGGGTTVALLAGAGLFVAMSTPHISYLVRADKFRELAIITGLAFAAFIVALALLLPNLILTLEHMDGTAIAVLVSAATGYVVARYLTWKILKCKPHPKILAHILSAGLMMATIEFFIWYYGIELEFGFLLILAFLGFFVYILCLYLTGEMMKRDYYEFRRLTKPE